MSKLTEEETLRELDYFYRSTQKLAKKEGRCLDFNSQIIYQRIRNLLKQCFNWREQAILLSLGKEYTLTRYQIYNAEKFIDDIRHFTIEK